ncbi:dynein regulatory complex subunit 2-like isoform X2 [Cephus cinctus]|uniref:Dynein regulatory complex subunit 2 n=1 Tax=Cephus cinctus TaxID=211228 RepID=A0AAJ7RFW6_CEPCN|nr:dynein regulatory complex subunit 2-like isoform X2 [Cephus cinctus]
MPPKKKKKAAEKRLHRQQQLEERQRFLKREHLRREVELGALNIKRFKRRWREMAMRAKMPVIKENLEVAWHTFDRTLDIKNYSISILMDALDEAEEQYLTNERAHIENIDKLMKLYGVKLQNEEMKYQNQLQDILDAANVENERISYEYKEEEVFFQDIMKVMKHRLDELLNNIKSMTISKVNELAEDNDNSRRIARNVLEKQIAKLRHRLRRVLTHYQKSTDNRRKMYISVKTKDDEERTIIAKQVVRTGILFETIRKLKEKITTFRANANKDVFEIASEHAFFHSAYWMAKNRFLLETNIDKNQLTIITSHYNRTMQHLQRLITKGEYLLVMIQTCRKYETQDEKILPFSAQVVFDDHIEKELVSLDWDKSREVIDNIRNLEQFWRRAGMAQITTTELRMERDKLKLESRHLRECLRHCIASRSLISPSREKRTKLPQVNKKPVVIDGNLYLNAQSI